MTSKAWHWYFACFPLMGTICSESSIHWVRLCTCDSWSLSATEARHVDVLSLHTIWKVHVGVSPQQTIYLTVSYSAIMMWFHRVLKPSTLRDLPITRECSWQLLFPPSQSPNHYQSFLTRNEIRYKSYRRKNGERKKRHELYQTQT